MSITDNRAPGVYIQEVAGSQPISGVGTSTAAFVGFTAGYDPEAGDRRDPDGVRPQLVTSWDQYVRVYGGHAPGAMLPHAVQGFFANGGTQAFIVRLPGGTTAAQPAQASIPAAARLDVESLQVRALEAGGRIEIAIDRPLALEEGAEPPQEFTLRVMVDGVQREEYPGLTVGRGPRSAEKAVTSTIVQVKVAQAQGLSATDRLPNAGVYQLLAPSAVAVPTTPEQVKGSVAERTGYEGLAIASDVSIVAVPDLVTIATSPDGQFDLDLYTMVQRQLIDWAEQRGTAMVVLDAPPGLSPVAAGEWRESLGSSVYAAAYYPQLLVANPLAGPDATRKERYLTVPPSGHVAGVWARTDATRGVWKAPANEVVRGIQGLEFDLTEGEQARLNPEGVNCIRAFGSYGIRIWGARTLASRSQQSWRYVPVRRLFNYVEESIRQGTQWAVFEPNDLDLWQRVKRTANAFLIQLWRQGALFGSTPDEAFYVKCDASNNPPESRDQGVLIVEIGIAPVKPAEFIVFKISQWQGGGSTAE
ncbi:MAG: phage tail sheath subtilisin-like domain-containing protein [Kineosporiaceae bacterium]